MMRISIERDHSGVLLRLFAGRWSEVVWVLFGLSGLAFEIEFPSDWHERAAGRVRIGLGLLRLGFLFPWPWTVPDDYQCSGPKFGFVFFGDGLHLSWGKCHGKRDDPFTIVQMPWGWRHRMHEVLGDPAAHAYRYTLRSGEVQERVATIKPERRVWTRPWFPWTLENRYIDIDFNDEVGERSGSWKGGVLGCGYDMLPGEAPLDTLRRMERERTFT